MEPETGNRLFTARNRDIIIIASTWLVLTFLHFFSPIHHIFFPIHEIFRQLYYLPIIYASFSFGLRGGLITSFSVALIYFIHITWQWNLPMGEYLNQLLATFLFIIIGSVTGILVEKLRREQRLYKETSEKLSLALEQQKEYQKQLIFSERMRSLGELAAGLAHEIKNPLGAIKSSAEIIKESFKEDSPVKEFLDILLKETSRLNKIVTNFLTFARPVKPELLPCSIKKILEHVMKLVKTEMEKNNISLEKDISEGITEISADAQQLQQVFLNLSLNAIQAMPEGGKLFIRVREEGEYMTITFRDTGRGISKENLDKLFTPFFSTKKNGTGLGLATSYRIIENHGGSISVESEPDKGTSFIINMPLITERRSDSA